MAQEVREQDIENEIATWLRLSLIPNFGPVRLNKFLSESGLSVLELLSSKTTELKLLGFNEKQISSISTSHRGIIEKCLDWRQQDKNHHVICPTDSNFPDQLLEIASPPYLLFGKGNLEVLCNQQIAIVGSRMPSISGKSNALKLAKELAEAGVTITSGLASGIDTKAHEGALNGGGATIAVLGNGVDIVYPKRNLPLVQKMLQNNGLLLSEFLPHQAPKPENFPRRNRIVSGLSLGVVIVEAAIKSGSLITAKTALDQNREVFAVPGNINNPLSEGCHYLIKQGAKLVHRTTDILEEFFDLNSSNQSATEKNFKKSLSQGLASDKLLDSVDYDITALDVILQRTKLPIKEVLAQLLDYELRGLVTSVSGGYVKLRGK